MEGGDGSRFGGYCGGCCCGFGGGIGCGVFFCGSGGVFCCGCGGGRGRGCFFRNVGVGFEMFCCWWGSGDYGIVVDGGSYDVGGG